MPGPQDFAGVMRRTIQLVGTNVPRSTLQKVAELLHALRWEFKDYGVKIYFLVDDQGRFPPAALRTAPAEVGLKS